MKNENLVQLKKHNLWWIGGSPGAGKTSAARRLGEKYNIYVYHCDEHYKEHVNMATIARQPIIRKLAPMSENEFWMRPVEEQYKEAIKFYTEEFELMLANLKMILDREKCVIIEGTIIMPQLLVSLNVPRGNMLWMIPTATFQRKQHMTRGVWVHDILQQCEYPEIALENWMSRDEIFAQHIVKDCKQFDLPYYITDGNLNELEMFNQVERYFLNFGFPNSFIEVNNHE